MRLEKEPILIFVCFYLCAIYKKIFEVYLSHFVKLFYELVKKSFYKLRIANIRALYAWQANSSIYEWLMRTQFAPYLSWKKNVFGFAQRWVRFLVRVTKTKKRDTQMWGEFRLRRIFAHSPPDKRACRSTSGECEPNSRLTFRKKKCFRFYAKIASIPRTSHQNRKTRYTNVGEISPLANIRALCAWQASLSIYEWRMRTQFAPYLSWKKNVFGFARR